MDFVKFSSATCNVFPIANSQSGGQFVTEYNLRSREGVGTDPNITYTSYPSYTHGLNDFAISVDSNNQNKIIISAGRCVLNGHYFESETDVDIDLLGRGLSGNLKIGLRAYYSTDATLSGSLIAEDDNYMLKGIRVVILPENSFVTPSDSPDDERAVTAHLLLGSFTYLDGIVPGSVTQNNGKLYAISADRIFGIGTALDGKYLTTDAIYPSGIFTLEGRGYSDGSVTRPTWSNSTDSLMVWDINTETTDKKPVEQSAQFNTAPLGNGIYTILQVPHKQIEGYYDAVSGNRMYFPTKNIPLPLADFDRGTAGTVDRNYTNKVKEIRELVNNFYMLSSGKMRAFIEEIGSLEDRPLQLPPINNGWDYGDYVIVRNDLSLELGAGANSTTSTMYVVLGPYVKKVEYAGEVYQNLDSEATYIENLNNLISGTGSGQLGLTGTDINSSGVNMNESLGNAPADFIDMYYNVSEQEMLDRKDNNGKYNLYGNGIYNYFSSLPRPYLIGAGANSFGEETTQSVLLGENGIGYIPNHTTVEYKDGQEYTIVYKIGSDAQQTKHATASGNVTELDFGTVIVGSGNYIKFDFGASNAGRLVTVKLVSGHSATPDLSGYLDKIFAVAHTIGNQIVPNYYDIYIYTGDANVGMDGYIQKCSNLYCDGHSREKLTVAIDNFINDSRMANLQLTDTDGNYIYRVVTKSTDGYQDYMTITYVMQSGTNSQIKYLTQVFTISSDGVEGSSGYSNPILLTGPTFLATQDSVGGFYNIDSTNPNLEDNGYVYLDSDGHLRLYDYELLRSAELAYILDSDKVLGEGLTYEELQNQLDDGVNNRVAFPTQYTTNTDLNQFVVNLTIYLAKSDTDVVVNLDNIDQRYGTAVILTIRGDADEHTTLNIVNCNKIKINPNISGIPTINVINSGICYDAVVFNAVNTFQNISLWYERYSESDPNLSVNGMTVTDLDVASFVLGQSLNNEAYINQPNMETVQYELTFGDYRFTYGLRSVTIAPDGSVAGVGIYIKNQSSTLSSTSSVVDDSSRIYLAKFRLPQSVNLQYPISRLNANIRIDGSFIAGYELSDNNKYVLNTNSFAALVNSYDYSDTTTYEISSGIYYAIGSISYRIDTNIYNQPDISIASDVIIPANVSNAMDMVLRSFDNNEYHIFDGHSIPVIGQ